MVDLPGGLISPPDQPSQEQLLEAISNLNNIIGGYVLLKKVGEGGIAEVYKAWQVDLKRYVAIKKLQVPTQEETKRLIREAQIAAKLQHPNIVQVYDMLTIKNQNYIIMQYIDGKNLLELKLSRRDILKIIQKICNALEYAHEHGIVHRDIKPGNIMLDKSGECYLTDFGLARHFAVDTSISQSGYAVGTPWFMSPEQAMGNSKGIDYRSDVFSLGSTLYKLMTGKPPFDSTEVYGVLKSVVEDEPVRPRTLNKTIERDLETIILKAMEKDRTKRYQSAKDMADDIDRYLNGEPVFARRASTVAKLVRKVKKNKVVAITILATLLIVATIGLSELRKKTERNAQFVSLKQLADEYYQKRDWVNALKNYKGAEVIRSTEEIQTKINECTSKVEDQQRRLEVLKRLQNVLLITEKIKRYFYDEKLVMKDAWELIGRAHDELDELKKIHSGVSELYYIKGALYSLQLMTSPAIDQFINAIKHDQGNYLAHAELAKMYTLILLLPLLMYELPSAIEQDEMRKVRSHLDQAKKYVSSLYGKEIEILNHKIDITYNILERLDVANDCQQFFEEYRDEEFYLLAAFSKVLINDLQGAKDYLTKAIDCMPRNAVAYLIKGLIYKNQGDLNNAIRDTTKVIQFMPKNDIAYAFRGLVYACKGEYAMADEDFNTALKLNPDLVVEILLYDAAMSSLKGNRDRAMEILNKALVIKPNSAEAYFQRGAVYADNHEDDKAMEDFNRALKLNPRLADAYTNRGTLYAMKGDYDKGIEDFTKALELKPGSREPYSNRGSVYILKREYDRAIQDYTQVLKLYPMYADAYAGRALAYERRGEIEKAISDLEKALEVAPENWEHYAEVKRSLNKLKSK